MAGCRRTGDGRNSEGWLGSEVKEPVELTERFVRHPVGNKFSIRNVVRFVF